MKRTVRPSKKMVYSGGYSAGSLAELTGGKKVDMTSAKEVISLNRKRRAKLLGGQQIQDELARRKRVKIAGWWRNRRDWRSYQVGDRIGKVNAKLYRYDREFRVEFPDGTSEWVSGSLG